MAGLAASFGSGAMSNSIREIRDADCIIVTGSNTGEAHPVISYEVVRAVKRGANLIVIDPRIISLVNHASIHLQPAPGTDHALYLAMLNVIVSRGWADMPFIKERTECFDEWAPSLQEWTPERAAEKCGVPADRIVEAARLYALGLRKNTDNNGSNNVKGCSTILYGMGITERSNGTELVKTLGNLAMVTGQIGRPSTGVNPLRGQVNVQGGCDMGSLPNVYPGYQQVADAEVRTKFAMGWTNQKTAAGRKFLLPDRPGLTFIEMVRAAVDGRIKAMYILGENMVMTNPDSGLMERSLRALDFLVVQEIFLTETAQLAHVVLPGASFAEKSGTFTNSERRVQLIRPFLSPQGEARPDWAIIAEIGRRVSKKLRRPVLWKYPSAADVMQEISELCPIFGGISHERIAARGIQWPCPTPDHPGTLYLHKDKFSRGRGKFHVTSPAPPFEPVDEEYPLALSTGRILYHYNGGPMTRRAAPLEWRAPRAYVEIHPEDAAKAGILDANACVVRSRRGSIRVQARVGTTVQQGMVYIPFHFREAAGNVLTHADQLDAGAKTPEYKYIAVRVESLRAK